jgi:hypothetical protein
MAVWKGRAGRRSLLKHQTDVERSMVNEEIVLPEVRRRNHGLGWRGRERICRESEYTHTQPRIVDGDGRDM